MRRRQVRCPVLRAARCWLCRSRYSRRPSVVLSSSPAYDGRVSAAPTARDGLTYERAGADRAGPGRTGLGRRSIDSRSRQRAASLVAGSRSRLLRRSMPFLASCGLPAADVALRRAASLDIRQRCVDVSSTPQSKSRRHLRTPSIVDLVASAAVASSSTQWLLSQGLV